MGGSKEVRDYDPSTGGLALSAAMAAHNKCVADSLLLQQRHCIMTIALNPTLTLSLTLTLNSDLIPNLIHPSPSRNHVL